MMGGKLEVESEPGKGSCFYFTLSMPFAGERGGDAGMEKSGAAADFSGKRILVVEDNDINREIAVTLLEGWGFMAEEAVNGKEAVEKFLDAPPYYYDEMCIRDRSRMIKWTEVKKRFLPICAWCTMTTETFWYRTERIKNGAS